MSWQFNSTEAVFIQIANRLRADIVSGKYPPDSQVPPVRQLAFEASVNPNTMQKALTLLEDEGLLYTRSTVGRFITSDTSVLFAARERIRREALLNLLKQARTLGITNEELIDFIKEDNKNEHTDTDLQ